MVVVLCSITVIAALLVAVVNDMTKDAIEQSKINAKNAAKFQVVGANDSEAYVARDTTRTIGDFNITVSTVVSKGDDSVIGYAVEAPSILKNGYSDRIYLMVGFVEKEGITSVCDIAVLSQKETPGLGANMTKEDNSLIRSIAKKNPASLKFSVTKEGGSFDALTGSTISSRAYANAVETAYAGYLWATGRLDTSNEALDAAPSGASMPYEEMNNNEPEAQKGGDNE
jgi:electron transport complex protein RnfG